MEPDNGSESRFLPTPPAFDTSLGGFRSEYCHDFWYGKKLEWCGYQMVKKLLKICLFVLTESTNATDTETQRQTDGHRMTAKAALA